MKTKKQTKTQNTSKINDNVELIFDKLNENNHLKIIKLVISDFKSFKGCHEIPLCMNYNAIMGATGSGKSNILDALQFVLGANSNSLRSEKLNSLINSNIFKSNSNQQSNQKGKDNSFVELHLSIYSNENIQKDENLEDLLNSSDKLKICFVDSKYSSFL